MAKKETAGARAIDIHHHYIPDSLLDEAQKHGKSLGVELITGKQGQHSLSFAGSHPHGLQSDLMEFQQRRLTMMDETRIGIGAAQPWTAGLAYPLSGEQGESWCRLYNEGLAELVRMHPERFVAIAAVPLQDPPRAARVLEHAVRDLNFRGGYIGSNVNGRYYDSTDFDPFWKKAEELDTLIVMHPEDVAGAERMAAYGFRLICGNPADSTLSIGFMTYSGVFDRFPSLKLCVLHGGGFFPYQIGRFDQGHAVRSGTRGAQAASPPSAYLKNLFFDAMVYRVDTLDYLRRVAGASQLMVGTDYPFTLGDWKCVEKVEALDCSNDEKEAIIEGNARRLLKLPKS
jgi:aminocarboxymuconate-semialdehyde decarboxylase